MNQLSSLPNVKRVVSLGTLCAIELKAEESDAGYDTLETYISFFCYIDGIFDLISNTCFVERKVTFVKRSRSRTRIDIDTENKYSKYAILHGKKSTCF